MKGHKYAVAVFGPDGKFLLLSIRRDPRGDVYVNFPRRRERADWKPHASYHRDGRHHQKSFGREFLGRKGPKPDAQFAGAFNLVTTMIEPGDGAAIGFDVPIGTYDAVFEIPVTDLSSGPDATQISVDITDAHTKPMLVPEARIIRSFVGKDALPWIAVTVYRLPLRQG